MSLLKRTEPVNMPVKVIQFGEGNFLRAFIDWMINTMNKQGKFNGMVQIVQPLEQGMSDMINAQEGLYTLVLRGVENGKIVENKEVIECVKGCLNPYHQWLETVRAFCGKDVRFVFSNTTEAGIEFKEEPYTPGQCQNTYPAKITSLLYERFAAGEKGLNFLPCELIDKNGTNLKNCILKYADLWNLSEEFKNWVKTENTFFNTLVDRIVAGYPRNEAAEMEKQFGYEDKLIDCGEIFHFFVIEGPKSIEEELPLQAAGLNVVITDNQTPYRTRKVRFLNGAHTGNVLAASLGGLTYVDEMMKDPVFGKLVRKSVKEEIYCTVDLPDQEKTFFADSVMERFENPFAMHRLLSISLNSVSKWKVRVLPSLLDYVKLNAKLPQCLAFSLAALIRFYMQNDKAEGTSEHGTYPVSDSPDILKFFAGLTPQLETAPADAVKAILANTSFWEMDLNTIPGMTDYVTEKFVMIREKGIRAAAESIL
ncbi:MAG: tagaturonate reductase [Lentisphaerae bacterium]|nr:tagaturonate reductase [Lentisphaerota bacterium]